jgi:hypothetical protein
VHLIFQEHFSVKPTTLIPFLSGDIWYPDDFNDGHAEYFLFLLSALSFFAFILFKVFAHGYISIKERERLISKVQGKQHKQERSINKDTTRKRDYDWFTWSTSSSDEDDPELKEQFNRFLERGRVGSSPPTIP